MKIVKSLTCLFTLLLVSACNGHSSGTFSYSSQNSTNNSVSSSSSAFSSASSLEASSSQDSSSSEASSSSAISSSSSEQSSSQASSSSQNSSSSPSSSSQDPIDVNYYDGYYDSLVSWTDGEDLKNQLNAIIRNGYTPLSYTKTGQNYATNINADHTMYDFEYLDVIYSDKEIFKTETNKGWQREHAWCASLMCGSTTGNAIKYKGRATDFHNLFAADAGGNQGRGNKNYGYADPTNYYYVDRTTSNGQDGYKSDEITFEPANKDRGRLARAIFYMATMYKDGEYDSSNSVTMKGLQIVEEPVSYVAGNDCKFSIGNLSALLSWNNTFAVDYLEMQHNISVYTSTDNLDKVAQGNRNPYVDYPELVDYVYGDKKDMAGTLKSLTPSASYLNSEDDSLSHYAIKEAKREHDIGDTLSNNDYTVVAVKNDYSYENVSTGITHSLENHQFTESDGDVVNASIQTPLNTLSYQIVLNPMAMCSHQATLSSAGISATIHNADQEVSYGGIPFVLRYDTTIADGSTFYIRNIGTGGVTLGSGNSEMTSFVLKTKNEYTVDRVYIKACASNTSSSYNLTIKVGDTVLWDNTTVSYLKNGFNCYGGAISGSVTGQVSYIFTGSTALKINSVAFNQIIA